MVRRTFRVPVAAWWIASLAVLGGITHTPDAAAQTAPLVCDADFDRDIDRNDLTLINAARNQSASGPTDPRDADRDGIITVNDGRICALRCTLAQCAVPPANRPPVANAGADQSVTVGDVVTLTGAGSSDPDGNPLTYRWTLTPPAGSAAVLSSTTAVMPTFTADIPGSYNATLIVNDGSVDSPLDAVRVTTSPINNVPVANAGADQTAFVGETVTLDGSASSDVDGDPLTFAWRFLNWPAGSDPTLTGADTVAPTFVPTLSGDYVVELRVADGRGGAATDATIVTTTVRNLPPTAEAGPAQSVAVGQTVFLDGGASTDPEGAALQFSWSLLSRPPGSTAVLQNPTTQTPSFFADIAGTFIVQLIVSDGVNASAADTVVVTTENTAPVANAGADQTATVGDTVLLDGTGSLDANNDPLAYRWSFVTIPLGSSAVISSPLQPLASFIADAAGLFVVQLIVNDSSVDSAPDTTRVTIEAQPNTPPVAADDTATTQAGVPVTIDVLDNDTDADADPLSVTAVTQPATGGVAAIVSNAVQFSPAAGFVGTATFSYSVSDGNGGSDVGDISVVVTALPTVTAEATDAQAAEAGADPGTITLTRSGATTSALIVSFTVGGSATSGADYAAIGTSVTIPAGASTAAVTIVPVDDAEDEDDQTVVLTVVSGAGYAAGTPAAATVTIADNDDPIVTIAATDASASESGANPGTFTISRSGSTAAPLSVIFGVGGTATAGADYATIQTSVLLAVGQASATVAINPLADNLVEGSETVVLTLIDSAGYDVGAPATATVTIADDAAVVSVQATDAAAAELGADAGVFTVSRSGGDLAAALLVDYTVGGTATNGGDYAALGGSVTIPANQTSATVTIAPVADNLVESAESAVLTLVAASRYQLGAPSDATVTIADDAAQVSVMATDATASEAGDTGLFTFTRSGGNLAASLSVSFTRGGTAVEPADYSSIGTSLVIPAGQASAALLIAPVADALVEGDETVTVTVDATAAYQAGTPASATVTIADATNRPPVAADDTSATEANTPVTIDVLANDTDADADPLTVSAVTQPATGGTVAIGAGGADVSFTPAAGFSGVAAFSYTVSDGRGGSDVADVTVTVSGLPTLSIGDVTIDEGNAGQAAAALTVTLSSASSLTVTADFATLNGTAVFGSDYVATGGSVTFAPGATTQTVTVQVNGDTLHESGETFFVNLTNPSNATLADSQGIVTVANDDAPPSLAIGDLSALEGNAGTTPFAFTVTQSAVSGLDTTVEFSTADGTATAPSDYAAVVSGSVSIPAGSTTGTATVNVVGDAIVEADETFLVNLANPGNATIADAQATGTIVNDEGVLVVNLDDAVVGEGGTGTLTATLTSPSALTVTVDFATSGLTAAGGADYIDVDGTLTFAPGVTSQTIQIVTLGDATDEGDETVQVTLGNPVNATIGDGLGLLTIVDDDALPTLAIDDVTVVETDAGTVNAIFTVSLSAISGRDVGAVFATSNGTAAAGSDYAAATGPIAIPAGQASAAITVVVNSDLVPEAAEAFFVTLSAPTNATIADAEGLGTIVDNDLPLASIDDVSVSEGNGGTTTATLTISLSTPSTLLVNVGWAAANGSAIAPADFVQATGVAAFAPGATTQTVAIAVNGDTLFEGNETFSVNLDAGTTTGAVVVAGGGTVTILDDDATATVTVTATDATAAELGADTGAFTISRVGGDTALPMFVNYTLGGTATFVADYNGPNGSFATIQAGEASVTLPFTPNDDALVEGDETVVLTLVPDAGYNLGTPTSAQATITDDDFIPTVTVVATDGSSAELGGETGTFTITRAGGGGSDAALLFVNYTLGGTALFGADYSGPNGSFVLIPAGEVSVTLPFMPADDALIEGDETVVVTLTADPAYILGAPVAAQATITDDDFLPTVTVAATDPSAAELGAETGTFTITRAGGGGSDAAVLFVNYTFGGTALFGTDYTGPNGTFVMIPAGEVSVTLPFTPVDDALIEGDETVVVTLTADAAYTLGTPATAQATITDDDVTPTVTIAVTDATSGELGADGGTFTITRAGGGGSDAGALFVNYTLGGTATFGSDYTGPNGSFVMIPAGEVSVTLPFTPFDDAIVEGDETVVVTLTADPAYTLGAPAAAVATIDDDDFRPTVTIAATDASSAELGAETGTFTITRAGGGGSDAGALFVNYTLGGTALFGTDYSGPNGTFVMIPAGEVSVTLPFTPVDDALAEGDEIVIVTLTADAGYTLGAPAAAQATIVDDDAVPTVTIELTDAEAAEQGTDPGAVTITRAGGSSNAAALLVSYTLDGTATLGADYTGPNGSSVLIPAGEVSVTLPVTPVDDALVEGDETVIVMLAADASYTLGLPTTAEVNIVDNDNATTLQLSGGGGQRLTLQSFAMSVSSSAAAPAGGLVVSLSSSDPALVSVPPTATIPEGMTSAPFTATTGTTAGTAVITAAAAGLTGDTANVPVVLRGTTLVPSSSSVGIGRSINAVLTLAQPAPVGGATFTLASSDPTIATVTPTSLTVLEGAQTANVTLAGLVVGGVTISADAAGFTPASAPLSVIAELVNIGVVPALGPSQSVSLPISLSTAAVGDVIVTLTSADPGIATVTPTVTIPNGQFVPAVNPQVTGVAVGSTTVTAAAAGYAPEARDVFVALSLTWQASPGTILVPNGASANVLLTLSAPAAAGGYTVNLVSDDPAVATVPATITFPQGQTLVQVPITSVAPGATAIRASAAGVTEVAKAVQVVALGGVVFNVATTTVGDELQVAVTVALEQTPPAAVDITLSVPVGSGVLLSSVQTEQGTETLLIPGVANTAARTVYVQGTAQGGPTTVTATASGYLDDTLAVTVTPSGFIFDNIAANPTTLDALSPNVNVPVRSARLNADGTYAANQAVRGGTTVPVAVTSSNPAAAVWTNSPLTFAPAVSVVNAVFDPLAQGTTVVAITQPPGFVATTTANVAARAQYTVNLTSASVLFNVATTTVGDELQVAVTVALEQTPPAAVDITLSVPVGSGVLLSSVQTEQGTETLLIPGVANTAARTVYVQGTAQGGPTTVTATASGYLDDTLAVTVTPSGFIFDNIAANPTTLDALSPNVNVPVRSARLNADGTYAANQAVRGGTTVPVAVTSSNPAAAVWTNSPLTFAPAVSVVNAVFDPLAQGTTVVAITQPPGFVATTTANVAARAQYTVNLTSASVLFNVATTTVGDELQVAVTVALEQTPPAAVDITLSVPVGSGVLLSSVQTEQGTETLLIPGVANTAARTVYVQGTAQGGPTTVTATASGYLDDTLAVTVTPSGFIFDNIAANPTTLDALSPNVNVPVRSARLNADGTYAANQAVRGGTTVPVAVTSSNPAAAVWTNSPLTFAPAVSVVNAVFDPLAQGTTVVAITQPPGFVATTTANVAARAQYTVNLTSASVLFNVATTTVGDELQVAVTVALEQTPPAAVDITLSVPALSGVLLSSVATAVGTETLVITGVANTAARTVYIQATQTGATTVTAQAAGFNDDTLLVTMTPSGFALDNFAEPTTNNGVPQNFIVQPVRLNVDGSYAAAQNLRGGSSIPVTVTSSNPAAGAITNSPLTFTAGALSVSFVPVAAGTTTITVVQPAGFIPTTTASTSARAQGTVNVTSGLPIVTLSAVDDIATEAGQTTGAFVLARSGGNLAATLTVRLAQPGVASYGTDFTTTPALPDAGGGLRQFTLAANQASVTINLTPLLDNLVEGDEGYTLTLSPSTTGIYVIGAPDSGTVTIADDPAVVTLIATDTTATEAGQSTGAYVLARSGGNLAATLNVRLAQPGAAVYSTDFTTTPVLADAGGGIRQFTLAASQASQTITITPVLDNLVEGDEDVVYTLSANPSNIYVIGVPSAGTVTISDDPPIVNLIVTDDTATEAGLTTGALQLTRTGGNAASLPVRIAVGGTAAIVTDYGNPSGWTEAGGGVRNVTIPAAGTLNVTITPVNDVTVEGDEVATFTLSPSINSPPTYSIGASTGGSITITSNE